MSNKTMPVFASGMYISDSGNLVISADEMDAAGVRKLELIEVKPTEAGGTMTREEFRIQFSRAVAEDDEPLFAGDDGELTNEGLDNLTNIAEASAEPLFDRIAELEAKIDGLWKEIDSHRAHVKHLEGSRDVYEQRAEKAEADAAILRQQLADARAYNERAPKLAAEVGNARAEKAEAEAARLTRELDMAKRGNRRQWDESARLRTALEEISERRFRCADKNCYASDVAREAIGPAAPAEEVKE